MNNEIWKDIVDYPNYQVSNLGRVKSKERYTKAKDNQLIHRKEKILKQLVDTKGYHYVRLYNEKGFKNKKVHRLVANAFVEKIKNKDCINHVDGNKSNNQSSNLEWCTIAENNRHSVETGLVDLELRKSNMSELGKSKRALLKRWHSEQFESMSYSLEG